MTILTVVQNVCDIVGVPRPSAVCDADTPDARQFHELANREVQDLAKRTTWALLTEEWEFLSVAQEEQTGALPADVAWIINQTFFNRSRQHRVHGPLSPEEWQRQKAMTTSIGIDQYRLRGNALLLMPVPPAGETYAFEYVTGFAVVGADGELKSSFTVDTDSGRLPERLLRLGMVWRWKQMKGLDYAEEFRTYEIQVTSLMAREATQQTLSAAHGARVSYPLVPEGNWYV